MEIGGRQEFDHDFEAHDLVDINQFSEDANAEEKVGINVNDHLPELHESTEPKRNEKSGRCNLRKSLAWDSAFFTSAGVLDPEELSSMMTGADKSEKPSLPGIEEEITRSTESLSTLESDSLTLEACEDDLFLDIRASIQRSSKQASNLTNSSSKKAATGIDNTAISSLKKEETVPQDKNPKLGLKKTSTLQAVRMPKCQPKQIGKLGSGKSTKQDSVHSQVTSIAKVGGTKSILPKPAKNIISSISSTASAKRESVGTAPLKSESSSKLGPPFGKGTQPSKISALSGSRNALPKPAVSSKSSLLGSSTTSSVHSSRSSTLSDSSTNTSSGIPAKPTIMTARRNLGKTSNVGPPASISKIPSRAPLRTAPNNKLPASNLSAYVKSSKISSSVSPASSVSEWSSASSSSSVANQRSSFNSRTSLGTSSCKSMDGGPTAGKQGVLLASNASKKSSTQVGAFQAPAKPSGLRMPSPSIGFFDGMKSPARTPNGHKQPESGLRTAFSRNGNTTSIPIRSSSSKLKSPRVPTAKTVNSLGNIKPASPKPASPLSIQEKSHASIVSIDVNDSSNLSLGAKGCATEDICQKTEKVQAEDGFKQLVGAGTSAIDEENLGDSSMCTNEHSEDNIKAISGSEYVEQMGDNVPINQDHLEKDLVSHPIFVAGDDIKTVSGSEYADHLGDNALLNLDHLKHSESHPICEAENDIKAVSGSEYVDHLEDNVLLNQHHLKKDSELHTLFEAINTVSVSEFVDQMEDNVPFNQDHLEKDSESHPICEAGDDVETVSSSEYVDHMGANALLNQDHLKKDSELHPICEAGDDIETVSGSESVDHMGDNAPINQDHHKDFKSHPICEAGKAVPDSEYVDHLGGNALLNQDHLKKDSELQPICEAGDDDIKTVSSSKYVDQMGENAPVNQDHLNKDSETHPICEAGDDDIKTVSGSEYVDHMGDKAPIDQDHLEQASESHPICEDVDDIKTVSGSESADNLGDNILLNQGHLKDFETHPICETVDDDIKAISCSEYVDQMGDNAPVNQDLLNNDSELHPICEAGEDIKTVSGSESVDHMGDNVLINRDHLNNDSESYPICDAGDNIKIDSVSEYVDQMGDNVLTNGDHLKKDSESHPICEAGDSIKIVSGPEHIDHMGDNSLIKQDHLKNDSMSHPIDKENDGRGLYQNVKGLTCELQSDKSHRTLSSSPAGCRAPLTVKNTCENVANELVIQVEKMGFVVPSSEQKENV